MSSPSPLKPVWRLLAVGFILGAFVLLWVRQSHRSPFSAPLPDGTSSLGDPIAWEHDEARALEEARRQKKPLVIDFTASWCLPCQELDRVVFHDPAVVKKMSSLIALRLDVSDENEANDALLRKYGVEALPTVAFVNAEGHVLQSPRITGVVEPDAFLDALNAL